MIAVTARTVGQALVDNDRCVTDSMRRGINNYIAKLWDDIRDCLALHFAFNHGRDTPFWRHCREQTNLAGSRALVDFYRDNGPSSLGSNLIPRNSIFRYDGYLAILIGQRVPTTYRYQPSSEDRQQWQQFRQRVRDTASYALSMDEGLRLVVEQS
jgi:tryptophan halogenase